MKSEFELAFNEIAELRVLSPEAVLDALSKALVDAYRKDAGIGKSQAVEVTIDPNSGRVRILVEKEVVDDVQDDRTEVELESARFYHPEANYGDVVMVAIEGSTTKKFGRIAAQTAKQIVLQKIRESERMALFDEFSSREGEVTVATVQSANANVVTVTIGRAEATMPKKEQIPGERYKPHDKIRVYIAEVERGNRGPKIIVSRAHRNMLRRLLEYEVPEIYNGQVEIKNIAREAGHRSKVAVVALQEGIDAVGACVGIKGTRIQNITRELHDERIDVIEWNPNQEMFISKALSPARASGVYLEDDPDSGRTALVIVPEDNLSQAIGKEGQNARLAAKLTGWRIDIKSVTEAVQEALDTIERPPLNVLQDTNADLIAEAARIMDKKANNRVVTPEEYTLLGRFADLAQRKILEARAVVRQKRLAEINAVRATLPQGAFTMPVSTLGLNEAVTEALAAEFQNVGEIMLRFLIDENRVKHALREAPSGALKDLQDALDTLVIPEMIEQELAAEPEAELAEEAVEPVAVSDEVPSAFPEATEVVPVDAAAGQQPRREFRPAAAPVFEDYVEEVETEDDAQRDDKKGKKKKGGTLIFDEKVGGVVKKKFRKDNRGGRGGWDDWEE